MRASGSASSAPSGRAFRSTPPAPSCAARPASVCPPGSGGPTARPAWLPRSPSERAVSLVEALSRIAEIEARAASLRALVERPQALRPQAGAQWTPQAASAPAKTGPSFADLLAGAASGRRVSGDTAAARTPGASAAGLGVERPLGAYAYPVAVRGKIIGLPYQGTHTMYGNWESQNAVDIAVPEGTPVYAVDDGVVGGQIGPLGSSDPRLAGKRLHLVTADNEYYYAHLSTIVVHAGQRVRKGDLIGYTGQANGVAHLHLAVKDGDPLALIGPGDG